MSEQTVDPAADPQQSPPQAEEQPPRPGGWWGRLRSSSLLVTFLAFVAALVLGGILIAVADPKTQDASHYFFQYPWDTFTYGFEAIWHGYVALFQGAIFNPHTAAKGTLAGYVGPISETLTNATPLILGGLSVGLAFRAGLFNIGGQGQVIMGAICRRVRRLPLAPAAGSAPGARASWPASSAGRLWGGLAGLLKAKTGAHEVITTIMLNYIALYFLGYLLSVKGFQAPPYGQAISNPVFKSAQLPPLLGSSVRVHGGLILALLAAVVRRVADRQEHARLPAAGGRREPVRRAHRRHERGEQLHRGDADRRRAVRVWPASARSSAPTPS